MQDVEGGQLPEIWKLFVTEAEPKDLTNRGAIMITHPVIGHRDLP